MMPRCHPGFMLAWEPEAARRLSPPSGDWLEAWPLEWSHHVLHGQVDGCAWLLAKDPVGSAPLVQWVWEAPVGVVLFFGILYSPCEAEPLGSELLSASAREDLPAVLRPLNGTFCGAVFHAQRQTLHLFTDSYAVERVYFARRPSGWAAATDPFLLARWCGQPRISAQAIGQSLYAGFIWEGSLFEGQSRVHAGCTARCDRTSSIMSEWVKDPAPLQTGRAAFDRLDAAHRQFWSDGRSAWADRAVFLLSRGKDSRILLKYLLEAGGRPRVLAYERQDRDYFPFVSYLLQDTADRKVAEAMAREWRLPFDALIIANRYYVDHLDEVVALNHGGPPHWEALAAAEAAADDRPLMICGFEGDVLASRHALPSESNEEAADRLFKRMGSLPAYQRLLALNAGGVDGLPDEDALRSVVRSIFTLSKTSDANACARWGFIRTQGESRNVPTFHQMRRYRIPIYPYLDNGIRQAYASLSLRELAFKYRHLTLIASDEQFARWPVSSSGLSARMECRLWQLLRVLPGSWPLMERRRYRQREYPQADPALEQTWRELGGDPVFWRHWSRLPRPAGYYSASYHLLNWKRIEQATQRLLCRATSLRPGFSSNTTGADA